MDFNSVANNAMDSIERPPLPPMGTYIWQVTKIPTQEKMGQGGQYETIDFQVRAIAPTDEIDGEDLAKFGGIKNITNRVRFMFDTQDDTRFGQSLFRLRTFLEQHLKCSEPGQSLKAALNGSVNHRFLGTLRARPDKENPEIMYAEIGKTAPEEA